MMLACLQCTVNNQIVVGTLMNICDNPNQVRGKLSIVPYNDSVICKFQTVKVL
jgi:hypothetical protein